MFNPLALAAASLCTVILLASSVALADTYDVRDYGATPDNGSDDRSAIQDALDAAAAADGGIVSVSTGTYNVGVSGISVPSHVTLSLESGAVLKGTTAPAGTYYIVKVADAVDVTVRGGTIVGTRGSDSGAVIGVRIEGSDDVLIDRVSVSDCSLDGIYVAATGTNGASERVAIRGGKVKAAKRNGIAVVHAKNVLIDGCSVSNTHGTASEIGIDIEPGASESVSGITVSHCDVSSNAGVGIQLYGSGISRSSVVDNTIHANGGQGVRLGKTSAATVVGNRISDNGVWGLYVDSGAAASEGHTIASNVVHGNTSGGALLNGNSAQPLRRMALTGNVLRSNGGAGLYATHTASSSISGNTVSGNTLGIQIDGSTSLDNIVASNVVQGNTGMGVNVSTGSVGTDVHGNVVTENGSYGIRVNASNDNVIAGNRAFGNGTSSHATYDNIHLSSASYNTVQGNLCRQGTQTNKSRYGIYVGSGANTNVVTNNDLKTSGAAGVFQDLGTGTVTFAGNRL